MIMHIFTYFSLIRYSIPAGTVYWTVVNEVWLPGAGSPEARNRLDSQKRAIDNTISNATQWRVAKVDPLLKPYVDPSKLPSLQIAVPDFIQYWNCGVRTVIRSIADFDAKRTYGKLANWTEKAFQSKVDDKSSNTVAIKKSN